MTNSFRSAVALAEDIRAGRLSAVDLMAETLDRIAAVNGAVNAIQALRDRDTLMAEAAQPRTGPLAGLPIAVKDLANAQGLPTTMGSPIFAGQIAPQDDLFVARMRAAGAIVIGKTNTPEFGLGSHTVNPVYGATRNAYDLSRSAGGSSGGAAVALATGMLALADGSDMMGSLRNPAAWNNVYGFRPSWGRVPSEPRGDTFLHQLSTNGPMARSPQDLALLLDVISGPDPRQPHGVETAPIGRLPGGPARGKRIAWLGDWGGAYPMEPGVLELCEQALSVFEKLGAEITPVPPPFPAELIWQAWTTLRSWSVAANLAPLEPRKGDLNPQAVWEMERGLALGAMEVHRASAIRSDWFAAAARLFESYDAMVLPSAQVWPFAVDGPMPQEINGQAMDTYHRWMEVVVPASLIGLPALALPAGFGAETGLPMGLQIIGRRGADAALLALGEDYHRATDWPGQRPALNP